MPRFKNKYSHVKLYRPNGHRYANGSGSTVDRAIHSAHEEFYKEFGEHVKPANLVLEVLGGTFSYSATIMEVLD